MVPLTKRQKEVLDFIRTFIEQGGYSPSLEEIGKALGMSSVATVHKHVSHLTEKGLLGRQYNKKRSIVPLSEDHLEDSSIIRLPLAGTIAAGEPIEAIQGTETISVPAEFARPRGRRMFVLKVKGSSMIEDHIMDGDFVVVVEGHSADNGQTVVALLDGENATLKKYYRENGSVRLQPANESVKPIIVKERDVRIQGVVVGLMRRY